VAAFHRNGKPNKLVFDLDRAAAQIAHFGRLKRINNLFRILFALRRFCQALTIRQIAPRSAR
jgi:hypothetical protein